MLPRMVHRTKERSRRASHFCAGETVPVRAPVIRRRPIAMPGYWRRVAVIALIVSGIIAGGMLWLNRSEDTRWARLGSDALAAHLALWTGLGLSLSAATYLRWGLLGASAVLLFYFVAKIIGRQFAVQACGQ